MRGKRLPLRGRTEVAVEVRRILPEIRSMIETARHQVAATANLALVNLYWHIGREISQSLQQDEKRAGYGDQLLSILADRLTMEYGPGYSRANLQDMRRFSSAFAICQTVSSELTNEQIRQTVSGESWRGTILHQPGAETSVRIEIDFRRHFTLGWSHYRLLLGQNDPVRRRFYFEQAGAQRWAVRELRRQIDGALFERVALSRNTRKLVALERKKGPAEIVRYEDIFKDPYILDFLGLKGAYSEKDLEAAIIRNLEQFLSELGTDFCFIGRQYPMRIDDTDCIPPQPLMTNRLPPSGTTQVVPGQ